MTSATIRRSHQVLILELPAAVDWPAACQSLQDCLTAAQNLVTGKRANLHLGAHAPEANQLADLKTLLAQRYALELIALTGSLPEQEALARKAELNWKEAAVLAEGTEPLQAVDALDSSGLFPDNAYYVRQTIRSGQSLRHFGTVVICGDVNPGAEVIATGDIIVFGTLRGVAHAGATGDAGAQIVAINLRPTQIRIAGFIARSPDSASPPLSKYPEVARIQDDEIHILPLRDTI
jgi:septum site-determining protein MinC